MPANLTPDYQRAERRYREATTHDEKLECLEEMLRLLPKHKGTDKIQAELRRKLSQMKKAGPPKVAGQRDVFHVPGQGAGQVALLGAPNVGKSSLVGAMTRAPVKVAEFPYSTHAPVPGMATHEDVPIQLVDLPPVTTEHVPPGMYGLLRSADLILVVIDAGHDSLLDDLETAEQVMAARKMVLSSDLAMADEVDDEGRLIKKAMVVATKCDLPGADENLALMRELRGEAGLRVVAVSAQTGAHLDALSGALFEMLQVVRVYAKPPGKKPDMESPFVIRAGGTIEDLAREVHRALADHLRYAKVWGHGVHDGQQVTLDHVLRDKDIVELHMSE